HVDVTFSPTAAGARSATLTVNADVPAGGDTVALSGTGTEGYYLATYTGVVRGFGDARTAGDASSLKLAAPIVSMVTTRTGRGYWLLGRDGGIFSFGDAGYYGSAAARHLARPSIGMARTPDAKGYWLVTRDGMVYAYGDAHGY